MSAREILFDARLVLEKPTGIGQYAMSLLRAMIPMAPDRRFRVIRRRAPWPGYGLAEWTAPNLEHVVSNVRHMSPVQHVSIAALVRRSGADVFHYPHFDAPVRGHRVPTVVTFHDLKYLARPEFFPRFGAAKRAYFRWAYASTLRRAACVIADSEATREDVRRVFGDPGDRMRVVPLAADAAFRAAPPEAVTAFRAAHGLRRPYALCVAEFRPHKNHAALFRAWAAAEARATHDLVLVGQRHREGPAPEELARAAGIETPVHVLPHIGVGELAAAYTGASAMVLLSLYEGFGLPVLEAMACGTPVLASDRTSLPEVVGDAGLLVDPEDTAAVARALDLLLGDEVLRRELVAKGAERCAGFRWERTARETLAIYDEVAGR
jgi:glycosyltransferase involved in cell wall biosynthesis